MSPAQTQIRLEPRPHQRDLAAGFSAAVQDPVWFLGRQWQMGEHQGENASSPVWVNYGLSRRSIAAADPRFDPTVIPAESIVESEIDDWWTVGRRIRIGQRLADHPAVAGLAALELFNPPPPYERFNGRPDGLLIWQQRASLGISDAEFGITVPADSTPAWDSVEMLYQQNPETAFVVEQRRLTVQRHRGGRLDWHSVDATTLGPNTATEPVMRDAIPTVLSYPGAPNSRWWQIENAEVDLGGYAPDAAHTPTALLTELIFSHSDDWFLIPVLAAAGGVVAIETFDVLDSFGRSYTSRPADDAGAPGWSGLRPPVDWTLFKVDGTDAADPGLATNELLLWHVAELPLESAPVERVQFGLDEESNLLWAVERTVDGREVESRRPTPTVGARFNEGKPSGDNTESPEYAYVPGEGIVPRWHPYTISDEAAGGPRRLVARRLVDLSRQKPTQMPAPEALVLQSGTADRPHEIAPLAIPGNGIEVDRRWMLARDMNGRPILWLQRGRRSLLQPPGRRLRFDVMEPANQVPG